MMANNPPISPFKKGGHIVAPPLEKGDLEGLGEP